MNREGRIKIGLAPQNLDFFRVVHKPFHSEFFTFHCSEKEIGCSEEQLFIAICSGIIGLINYWIIERLPINYGNNWERQFEGQKIREIELS